jgi:16S rRNA (guanine527-N7)-methyltransferase
MATLPASHHWMRQAGTAPQSEYGNLAGLGDRRDPIGETERRGKTERPVVPETSRRGERGQRNGSGSFGHGRHPDRSPLPRRFFSPLPESATDLPALPDEFWTTLDNGLAQLELPLDKLGRDAIDAHCRLLVAWNAAINLTSLRNPEQMALNHVLDSLLAVPFLASLGPTRILDLGSGGGFPGLPLAAALPVDHVTLVDSIGKKARFLGVAAAAVRDALDEPDAPAVEISALAERAEDLADEAGQREAWDVAVARAVGSVAEVAELGLPLIKIGGQVVMWKRDDENGALDREIKDAARICQACGGGPPRVVKLDPAEAIGLAGHCLVVVEKRRPTPDRYPRSAAERRRAS